MGKKKTYTSLLLILLGYLAWGQDFAYTDMDETSYTDAHHLAYEGDHRSAKKILLNVLAKNPDNVQARSLLASTYSWAGQYAKARNEFNKAISKERNDRDIWIAAIKNELYAKEDATALGLANKALSYLKDDEEIERLALMAKTRVENRDYPEKGWYNQVSTVTSIKSRRAKKAAQQKEASDKKALRNRISVNNALTVFSEQFEPQVVSSVFYRRQTPVGSIMPRINYSNRLGRQGLQYDIDFWPKFSKRFYAYLNYGYSNSDLFPKHKIGGDLYVNLPWAIEFSAGGRYIVTNSSDIKAITNSLGHYRGNYYFSLRSFITPRPDGLTRVSGNLLVRKYLKDAQNFMGINVGMGVSPELRQIVADDRLLAETLFFIESQRLNFEYQFTGKRNPNIYRARLGVRRQELASDSGSFFWGVTAGLVYEVNF